jgi:exodeoxyribonuclease V beta subunit
MSLLDPQTVALSGLNIIEASAGTGKTYTLAELYTRLVLEHDLTVDQILVVTYTKAAKEELRGRLRQRLVETRDELLADADHDVVLRQRLVMAIQSFDESAIFTIHGFCQRVLGDYAFESGQHFDLDMVGNDQVILQSAVDDFWRKKITNAEPRLASYLFARHESPEKLLQSIRPLLGKPYLQHIPVVDVDIDRAYQFAQTQFEKVKRCWQTDQESVQAVLTDKSLIHGGRYKPKSVEKWLIELTELLSYDVVPENLFKDFDRFTPAKLATAMKGNQAVPDLSFWPACEVLMEAVEQVKKAQALQYQALRYQCLQISIKDMPVHKQQQRVQSYDDLLLNLQEALTGSRGDWLVGKLREQFPAALIDEFQDTDPVQYASFSRIYADSGLPVFLVGDPKQAIYSFRGADIFTYLQAKSNAEHEYTLGTNWR